MDDRHEYGGGGSGFICKTEHHLPFYRAVLFGGGSLGVYLFLQLIPLASDRSFLYVEGMSD